MSDDKLILACATDDKKHFPGKHSGEAGYFIIYEIDGKNKRYVTTVENTSPEERMHGDPAKAKGVISLLKPFGVNVIVSKQFGRNLKRIKEKVVPVIIKADTIEAGVELCNSNYGKLLEQLSRRGDERTHIVL